MCRLETRMYLMVEENPNCTGEERVFSTNGEKKPVKKILAEKPDGSGAVWCDVVAVDKNGAFGPAYTHLVDDSSAGTAWLIFGGAWGLRLRPDNTADDWSLTNKNQWGIPFVVLDSSATSIQFK